MKYVVLFCLLISSNFCFAADTKQKKVTTQKIIHKNLKSVNAKALRLEQSSLRLLKLLKKLKNRPKPSVLIVPPKAPLLTPPLLPKKAVLSSVKPK